MGRPIHNRAFGHPNNSGRQMALSSCWVPGEGSANTTSYIVKQLGTSRYMVKNSVTQAMGVVTLATAADAAGKAVMNVAVSSTGSGATATARLGAATTAIVAGGTGYAVNNVLTVVGGTSTIAAQVTVSSVESGVVTGVTITTAGVYSVLPTGTLTVTGGAGTGFTLTIPTWKATGVVVGAGGSGYTAVTLALVGGGGSGATATGTITTGALASAVVTAAGAGYTSIPTVSVTPVAAFQKAKTIHTTFVVTFEGSKLFWKLDGSTPDATFGALPFA